MPIDPVLDKMLKFIAAYQQQNADKSSPEIIRELRAYTKPGYTSKFWELVAGDNPDFISGELDNEDVILAKQEIDFAHFIAALSDQFFGGSLFANFVDGFFYLSSKLLNRLPYDSREFTSAIGDTAQPITVYLSKYGSSKYNQGQISTLLRVLASDKDYASDLLAYRVGRIIEANEKISVADAIAGADNLSYTAIVKDYVEQTLGGSVNQATQVLTNQKEVKTRIQQRVNTYVFYAHDALKESVFNSNYRKQVKPALVETAAAHFLDYLLRHLK